MILGSTTHKNQAGLYVVFKFLTQPVQMFEIGFLLLFLFIIKKKLIHFLSFKFILNLKHLYT